MLRQSIIDAADLHAICLIILLSDIAFKLQTIGSF